MHCEVALCKQLTVENVASCLLLADQTEADMLKEACLEFIKPNVSAFPLITGANSFKKPWQLLRECAQVSQAKSGRQPRPACRR